MKKYLVALFAVFLMFFLTGCPNSPKNVAKEWTQAIAAGDLKNADKNSTGAIHHFNSMLVEDVHRKGSKVRASMTVLIKEIDSAKQEIKGDTAVIYVKSRNPICLKKVNGKWKVDYSK